jgi:hypothetical protein
MTDNLCNRIKYMYYNDTTTIYTNNLVHLGWLISFDFNFRLLRARFAGLFQTCIVLTI